MRLSIQVIRSCSLLTALLGMLMCALLGPLLNKWTFTWGNHTLHYIFLSPVVGLMAITSGEMAILKGARRLRALAEISVMNVVGALVSSVPIYYFFGQSNTAYRNGSYFIPNADKLGHFFPGSFKFDNKGKLISVVSSGSVSTDMTKYIDDGKLKIDGVIAGIGLFELTDGYIYYAKDDGSIVKNSTCYVSKVNDVKDASNNPIKAGLYWFDAEGHLCDSLMRPIYKGA